MGKDSLLDCGFRQERKVYISCGEKGEELRKARASEEG
jgi:hypothetical protein